MVGLVFSAALMVGVWRRRRRPPSSKALAPPQHNSRQPFILGARDDEEGNSPRESGLGPLRAGSPAPARASRGDEACSEASGFSGCTSYTTPRSVRDASIKDMVGEVPAGASPLGAHRFDPLLSSDRLPSRALRGLGEGVSPGPSELSALSSDAESDDSSEFDLHDAAGAVPIQGERSPPKSPHRASVACRTTHQDSASYGLPASADGLMTPEEIKQARVAARARRSTSVHGACAASRRPRTSVGSSPRDDCAADLSTLSMPGSARRVPPAQTTLSGQVIMEQSEEEDSHSTASSTGMGKAGPRVLTAATAPGSSVTSYTV